MRHHGPESGRFLHESVVAPKPQKLAENNFFIISSHNTWSDKLGGILGEDLSAILHSK